MKRLMTVLAVSLLTLAAGVSPVYAQEGDDPAEQREAAEQVMEQVENTDQPLSLDEIDGIDELGPNPWLSMTEGRDPAAVEAWQAVAEQLPARAHTPRGKKSIGGRPLVVNEREPAGEVGVNDTVETGQRISRRFGTDRRQKGVVTINGSLSGGLLRDPIEGDCESVEDDGSIPEANPTPAVELQLALCIGFIGDGPYGDTSGDVDFYSFGVVEEGSLLYLDVWHISNPLDPVRSIIGISCALIRYTRPLFEKNNRYAWAVVCRMWTM